MFVPGVVDFVLHVRIRGADIASAESAWPLHCGRNRADRLLRFLQKAVRRTDAAASAVV